MMQASPYMRLTYVHLLLRERFTALEVPSCRRFEAGPITIYCVDNESSDKGAHRSIHRILCR